ncbi:hypothethical protein [Ralstonia solanacearum PSI07]|nr:hypothethical protein [Ralstonia solanacearum PSI07]
MGQQVPTGLLNGTTAVPPQASPSATFPGIVGGGVYGANGGTSANAPSGTNPGNFSSSHQTLC